MCQKIQRDRVQINNLKKGKPGGVLRGVRWAQRGDVARGRRHNNELAIEIFKFKIRSGE